MRRFVTTVRNPSTCSIQYLDRSTARCQIFGSQSSHLEHACLTPLLGEPSWLPLRSLLYSLSSCYVTFPRLFSFLLPFVIILRLIGLSRAAFNVSRFLLEFKSLFFVRDFIRLPPPFSLFSLLFIVSPTLFWMISLLFDCFSILIRVEENQFSFFFPIYSFSHIYIFRYLFRYFYSAGVFIRFLF